MPDNLQDDLSRGVRLFVYVVLTVYVARYIKGRVERVRYLRDRDAAITELAANLIYVAVLAIGIISSLNAIEVPVTTVVTALGVSGLAVSLALQDVLRNFVAGIYLLLEKPYNIGDTISVREFTGEVVDVELRTTLLQTTTGARVLVPNSVLMSDVVTNRSPSRLQGYAITVSGGPELLRDGLDAYAALLLDKEYISAEPEQEVYVESMAGDEVTVCLRFWTQPRSAGVGDLVAELRRRHADAAVSAKAEA